MINSTPKIAELLYREAWYLDQKRWEDWLSLYAEDAIYWSPAMVGDDQWSGDPEREISLVYMEKSGLEARVFRIEGGDSYATEPLPHTSHVVTNVLLHDEKENQFLVSASWQVRSYSRVRGAIARGGLYEYVLRSDNRDLLIVQKKIFIHDDKIVGPIDIYNI